MTDLAESIAPPADLVARLSEWIKAEGIQGEYPPDQVAELLVSRLHHTYLERVLAEGGNDFLRDRCKRTKRHEDLTPEERAAERYWHGHGNE